MNTKELKSEIQKTLDNVPDQVLQDILDFLKMAESQSAEKISMARNLKLILSEDKELLQKLAQ